MMKILILMVVCIALLAGCHKTLTEESQSNTYSFDSNKYTIIDNDQGGNRFYISSIDDIERRARFFEDKIKGTKTENPNGIIIIAEVSGDSINRIIEPKDEEREQEKIYGINHVLTPIKVIDIVFKGKDVLLKKNDVVYLREPFFYVTDETPEYLEEYGGNTIIAEEYDPLEKGKTYVMYLSYEPSDIYDYEGSVTLGTLGLREAVYCISDEAPSKKANDNEKYKDVRLWDRAVAN